MTSRRIAFLILQARTRKLLQHRDTPMDRALALVAMAKTIDRLAEEAAITQPGPQNLTELNGTHLILTAALEHLHTIRHGNSTPITPPRPLRRQS